MNLNIFTLTILIITSLGHSIIASTPSRDNSLEIDSWDNLLSHDRQVLYQPDEDDGAGPSKINRQGGKMKIKRIDTSLSCCSLSREIFIKDLAQYNPLDDDVGAGDTDGLRAPNNTPILGIKACCSVSQEFFMDSVKKSPLPARRAMQLCESKLQSATTTGNNFVSTELVSSISGNIVIAWVSSLGSCCSESEELFGKDDSMFNTQLDDSDSHAQKQKFGVARVYSLGTCCRMANELFGAGNFDSPEVGWKAYEHTLEELKALEFIGVKP